MKPKEAKSLLAQSSEEEPVTLTPAVLSQLSIQDLPEGAQFQVGKHVNGTVHLDWNGKIGRVGDVIYGEADHTWTRKYWYLAIGLEHYLDLVRRAIETRQRTRGDVILGDTDDDGAFVVLTFRVLTEETNLARAFDDIRNIERELNEAAEKLEDEVGQRIAEVAARVSGWGSESLDGLVDTVDSASSPDDKGRALEELCSRLFGSIPGFSVTERIRTATEEIDISILNDSNDPRLRREGAVILAECKNWSGRCGKDELVLFHTKLTNRSRRCTLGFLISWNGFATTVTKEMLRGSREEVLVVPMTGEDIRAAVRDKNFPEILLRCWNSAVHL